MGYLHEGHMSLVRKSVDDCDFTSVSIFVNPTQFGEGEDFKVYPRDEEGDFRKCKETGVDFILMPDVGEMYSDDSSVYVAEDVLSRLLCGHDRPTHFGGVLTVVAKLFNILQPDMAYFGAKDFQQAVLIKRMVRDLNFPVEIKVLPTVREADGLAMSSRNRYLTKEERKQAVVLNQALKMAEKMYIDGERDVGKIRNVIQHHIAQATLGQTVYVEILDAYDLSQIEVIERPAVVALAVKFGSARLIDNIVLGNSIMEG
jgi:pantoate--beta-alanine ligase